MRFIRLVGIGCQLLSLASFVACGGSESPSEPGIGPAGGTVSQDGASVAIPEGTLSAPTRITVAATNESAPPGYDSPSRVFAFGPDGTQFALPVAVELPVPPGTSDPTIYWSNGAGGYDDVGAFQAGAIVRTKVTHFSRGFVASRRAGTPACVPGAACASGNGCKKGMGLCLEGVEECRQTTGSLDDGTVCGGDLVCQGGSCVPCTVGAACEPAPGGEVCHAWTISSCSAGPTCSDSGAPLADGTTCGSGGVCSAGTCGPPAPTDYVRNTVARNYVVTPSNSPAYLARDELVTSSPSTVTRRWTSSDTDAYQVRSYVLDALAVYLSGNAGRSADGSLAWSNTFSPPALLVPGDTTAGATASSTSTVTSGATTFWQTRSVTVDGVESVTVPAGTFTALKTTSYITQSNAAPTYGVNWWATGIGSVKSVTYPAANPGATTTQELTFYTPMTCSGGACACNALVASAPAVRPMLVATDFPAPAGGVIAEGIYDLTAVSRYTGPGGASGPDAYTYGEVFEFEAGLLQYFSEGPGGQLRGTLIYGTSGTRMTVTLSCGGDGSFGPPETYGFSANGGEVRLFLDDPGSVYLGHELVFTKR